MEALPELGSLNDEELRDLIDRYVKEENEVSYRRRILHGYIDILKSELLARKKRRTPVTVARSMESISST